MKPILWHLMVEPIEPPKETAGGIALPDETVEANERMAFVGKVLALGSLAYKSTPQPGMDFSAEPNKPQVGDYIVFGRHSGQRVEFRSGRAIVFLNDTDVKGVCDSAQEAMEVIPYV